MINWEKQTPVTCYCKCDTIFISKGQIDYSSPTFEMLSEQPCPKCHGHQLRKISCEKESFTIAPNESGELNG